MVEAGGGGGEKRGWGGTCNGVGPSLTQPIVKG